MSSTSTLNPIPYASLAGVWLDDIAATDRKFKQELVGLPPKHVGYLGTRPTSLSPTFSHITPGVDLFAPGQEFRPLFPMSFTPFQDIGSVVVDASGSQGISQDLQTSSVTTATANVNVEGKFKAVLQNLVGVPFIASTGFSEALGDLVDTVSVIRSRVAFRLSEDVEALIDRVIRAPQTDEDVEAWARRLADDARYLTD